MWEGAASASHLIGTSNDVVFVVVLVVVQQVRHAVAISEPTADTQPMLIDLHIPRVS